MIPRTLLGIVSSLWWVALCMVVAAGCSSDDSGSTADQGNDAAFDLAPAPDAARLDRAVADAPRPDVKRAPDRAVKPDGKVPAAIKVLFLGNSFTFFNNMPDLVEKLSASSGKKPKITVDSVTSGARRMGEHWADSRTQTKLKAGGWRFVVLQGQNSEPVLDRSGFLAASKALAARVVSYKGTPMFFQTFAYKKGHPFYKQYGGDPGAMQKMLRDAYNGAVAQSPGSVVAPVGDAFEAFYAQQSTPNLHDGDLLHPSMHGSYLAACVFWARMTGLSPVGITYRPSGVSAAQAKTLQTVANKVVNAP